MIISIIAALGKNRAIGQNNALPWKKLPADMKHFHQLTAAKPVIMGQKTFESIGNPLAGRRNIILTRGSDFQPSECLVVHSLKEALEAAGDSREVMIVGGASVYGQFLPLADRMYLTLIDGDFKGDAFFPEFNQADWKEVEKIDYKADADNAYNYSFIILERKYDEKFHQEMKEELKKKLEENLKGLGN